MKKKAIILDLDNTIYAVSSIGDKLFKSLFDRILNSGEFSGSFEAIRYEVMRRPFQYIAREFSFSDNLTADCMQILRDLTYNEPIEPFEDYKEVSSFPLKKYLVTVGFKKMQQSKVKYLNIEKDFTSIYIIDPEESTSTKKDIFKKIMIENSFNPSDLIVVGDDPGSEIKAARELKIDAILYNRESSKENQDALSIRSFAELKQYLM